MGIEEGTTGSVLKDFKLSYSTEVHNYTHMEIGMNHHTRA